MVEVMCSGRLETTLGSYITITRIEHFKGNNQRGGVEAYTDTRSLGYPILCLPRQAVSHPELLGRDSLLGMLYREEFRGTR